MKGSGFEGEGIGAGLDEGGGVGRGGKLRYDVLECWRLGNERWE